MVVWSEKIEHNSFDFTLIKRQANQQSPINTSNIHLNFPLKI